MTCPNCAPGVYCPFCNGTDKPAPKRSAADIHAGLDAIVARQERELRESCERALAERDARVAALEAENAALRETLAKVREAMPAGSTCWEGCNASDAIERVLAILDGGK